TGTYVYIHIHIYTHAYIHIYVYTYACMTAKSLPLQHIEVSISFLNIQSAILHLLIRVFSLFTYKVIIDMLVLITILLPVFNFSFFNLFLVYLFLFFVSSL
ncbi:unnamed protein product, partial [Rangifer tarandus platyrhynchus]